MIKLLLIFLIPFALLACDEKDKDTSTQLTKFQKAENKNFFKQTKGNEINYVKITDVDTTNNRLRLYEFGRDFNGRIVEVRNDLFKCDNTNCKTDVLNKEYETISVSNQADQVSIGRYEKILNKDDRLIEFTTYYSELNNKKELLDNLLEHGY